MLDQLKIEHDTFDRFAEDLDVGDGPCGDHVDDYAFGVVASGVTVYDLEVGW